VAENQREIELLIRAREMGMKAFDNSTQRVKSLKEELEKQVQAADKGEVSLAALTATMKKLEKAGNDLISQQGVVDLYRKMETQLDAARAKADSTSDAFERQVQAIIEAGTATRDQERDLERLARADRAAEARVDTLTKSLESQAVRLKDAGIPVNDLVGAQERLTNSAREVGAMLTSTGKLVDGYGAHLEALKVKNDELAAQQAFQKQVDDARKLQQASQFVSIFTALVVDAEANERELAEVQAFREKMEEAKRLRKAAEDLAFWNEQLDQMALKERELKATQAFQQKGTTALAASATRDNLVSSTAAAAGAARAPVDDFAKSIRAIIDPAGAARGSLEGLEGEIKRLEAQIGDGSAEIEDYKNAVADLGKVQGALVEQAGAVSAYKAQQKVVADTTEAYRLQRLEVETLATAVASAHAPDEALAASMREAETAAVAAGRAVENETKKLGALAGSLERAGIEANDLVKAEDRLRSATNSTATLVSRLNKANDPGGSGPNSKGFLGLRPYELQNLSYQINDVFTQLGSGASVTQTFAQQGGQIAQLFPNILKGLIPLAPYLTVAAIAFGVLFASIKRVLDLNNATRDFTKTLAASADGATYNAKALAQTAHELENVGVKTDEAREALKTFVREGVAPARLEQFTRVAKAMSLATGEDVPAAAKLMAEGFTRGYDAVKKLDDQFDFLTAAERTHIRAMFESGHVAEARTAAFDAFQKKMGTAAESARGPWAEAWRFFKNDFNSFLDSLSKSAPIQNLIGLLDRLAEATKNFMGGLPGSGAATTAAGVLGQYGNTAAPAGNRFGLTSSNEAIAKTAYLEGATTAGRIATLGVIINRMRATGASGYDVATAPKQFEPLNGADAAKRLASIDTNSHDYLILLASIEELLKHPENNPVGNATYFYSPKAQAAQAAKLQDGRSTVEGKGALSFATPQNYVGAVDGNKFYNGRYTLPGAPGGTTTNTEAQKKAGDDYLLDLQRQLATETKISDEQRLQNAYITARNKAMAAGVSLPEQIEQAAQAEKQAEAWKISQERAQEAVALASELNGAITTAQQGQTETLDTRIDAITKRFDILREKIRIDASRGGIAPDGVSLSDWKDRVDAAETLSKNTETMKFYEQQLQAIEAQRGKDLATIQDKVQAGTLSTVEGVKAVADSQANFSAQLDPVVKKARDFAEALQSAHPDPKTAAFLQMVNTVVPAATADGIAARLKIYQDALTALEAARSKAVGQLSQGIQDDSMDALGAYQQAQDIATRLNPEIASMAAEAAAFAESVKGAKPSPQLLAAIEAFKQVGVTASRTSGPTTPQAVVGKQGLAAEEGKLNDLLSQRDQLLQTYNELQSLGVLTTDQLHDKSKALYGDTATALADQVAKVRAVVEALHAQHDMTDEAYDAWIAKLGLVTAKMQYADPVLAQFRSTAQEAFVGGLGTGFDSAMTEVGKLIDGTQDFDETLKNLGDTARTFFANFLKGIGDLIVQMLALKAFEGIFGAGAAGGAGKVGGGVLSFLSGLMHHEGGTIGSPANMRRSNVSPLAWAAAPRYHTGAAGIGLRSDEVASILKKREEVLAEDDPRNILNGGAAAGGGAPGAPRDPLAGLSIKNVNLFDPVDVLEAALSTKAGERVILNWMGRNSGAVRGATNR
jgi:hypothetical protein